jgi:hypothetical protein
MRGKKCRKNYSTQGERTIAKNSSHYIQLDSPDLVIDEVRKMVEKVRR